MNGNHQYWHEIEEGALEGQEVMLEVNFDYTPEVKPRYNCEPSEDDAPMGEEINITSLRLANSDFYASADLLSKIEDEILEEINNVDH